MFPQEQRTRRPASCCPTRKRRSHVGQRKWITGASPLEYMTSPLFESIVFGLIFGLPFGELVASLTTLLSGLCAASAVAAVADGTVPPVTLTGLGGVKPTVVDPWPPAAMIAACAIGGRESSTIL